MLRHFSLMFLGAVMVLGWTGAAGAQPGECRPDCSQQVACYAQPSVTRHYIGYYVGGGQAVGGSCRCPDEGTWGWDYRGLLLPHRVILYWTHGRRYQGGTGAYKIDGPHVPDVPSLLNAGTLKSICTGREGASER